MATSKKLTPYVAPMAVFIALLAVKGLVDSLGDSWWLKHSEFWIFPLQTAICAMLLWRFWGNYQLSAPRQLWVGILVGTVVFGVWIAPQAFLGFGPRLEGFNPGLLAAPAAYAATVGLRFVRLVIVVPLVEEIFWRGFLLRYLINERFDEVPFGQFNWLSFIAVAAAFGFSHSPPDWPAAFLTGALYNMVAYQTKSLSTCVLTHGLTNLLLGLWIMWTKQWGFW
jgi:CAAX prenyl protease-like protein